jgi:hypothetical protein
LCGKLKIDDVIDLFEDLEKLGKKNLYVDFSVSTQPTQSESILTKTLIHRNPGLLGLVPVVRTVNARALTGKVLQIHAIIRLGFTPFVFFFVLHRNVGVETRFAWCWSTKMIYINLTEPIYLA